MKSNKKEVSTRMKAFDPGISHPAEGNPDVSDLKSSGGVKGTRSKGPGCAHAKAIERALNKHEKIRGAAERVTSAQGEKMMRMKQSHQ